MKSKYYIFIGVIILTFLAGTFVYPIYFNNGVDFLNTKADWAFPHFPEKPYVLGLDLQGGVSLIYQADLSTVEDKTGAMSGLRDVIERRVNMFGVSEPVVQIQGESRLLVEMPGVTDVGKAISMIGQTPYLEFSEQRSEEETNQILEKITEVQEAQEKGQNPSSVQNWEIIFQSPYFKSTELTGQYLHKATVVFNQTTLRPQIELQFNDKGARIFEEITARNVNKPIAIFLDGASIIDTTGDGVIDANDLYAPVVQEKITGGRAVITGDINTQTANTIASRLNSGALPVKIGEPISQKTVGPTLGEVSLRMSFVAAILGFFAIFIYFIIFYRLSGFVASLSLIFYVVVMLSIIKIFSITLTLSGIAGLLLSMGMAVDANILIFSRMREELRAGKSFEQSISDGTKRAWPSIRDGNLTTILVGLVLFFLGTSFVKGFAFTLILGNIVGVLTAILLTNFLLGFFSAGTKKLIKLWI